MDPLVLLNYIVAFFSLYVTVFFLLLFLRYRGVYAKPPTRTDWKPLVSIIVPAYNESEYLKDCLETVLAVDYPKDKLEIIVVDDGSKDDTFAIAKTYESRGIKTITKSNGGKGSALNFGIKQAKGELIATMDADSYLTPQVITGMLPLFDAPDVMAVTPAVKIREGGNLLQEAQRVEYLMILFSRRLLSFIESVPVTPGPCSIFRAEVFKKIGGFSEDNLVEDQEIALRIQANHYKIRSSMTAEVFTEPPQSFKDLMVQRVRWQRGGLRNYWDYKYLIHPRFGDFGVYFVPLNFATITAFFVVLGMMIYSTFFAPYYVKYMWLDTLMLGFSFFSLIWILVAVATTIFVYVAVRSFPSDNVKFRYVLSFVVIYWYMMVGYNVLTLWKEIRKEKTSW